jgi:Spy/CpxP family protein refolding chaperone
LNTKTKTSFVLIGTLLIGVAIGALGSALWRADRARKFELMRPENRFLNFIKGVIRPAPEQNQQFDEILGNYSKRISNIHDQHQEEILAVYDSLRSELNALLTDEQRARLEESLARGRTLRVAVTVGHLTEELDLSESQSQKIEEILRANEILPGRGRIPFKKRQEFHQEMRTQFEKIEKEIEAVLTPEQLEKYRELRSRRRFRLRDEPPPFPGERFKAPLDGPPE